MQPQQLTEAALSLPEPQRIELAASLIHSLEPAPDPEAEACWADEIRRRLESIDDLFVSRTIQRGTCLVANSLEHC